MPVKSRVVKSKIGFLAGLQSSVVERINVAYANPASISIPRHTTPSGSPRDESEWMFRLAEASFEVENELEHTQRSADRRQAAVLRERRNSLLDQVGENERLDMCASRG